MRSIELFAGAGGLAIGTSLAGFRHAAVLEWDKNACATLQKNASKWNVIPGDVRDYSFSKHQDDVKFVSGGPPCQPFSLGGKHGGHEDKRNMFPEAVRAVRELRPVAFLFENVKGLLRKNFSNYYSYIIQQLRLPDVLPRGDEEWIDHHSRLERYHTSGRDSSLKYNVVFQMLNAANYGVPQRRERVLIVGIRSDVGVEFSFPAPTHSEDALLYDKWVSGDYWEEHSISKRTRPKMPKTISGRVDRLRCLTKEMLGLRWRTVRDAIRDLPEAKLGETVTSVNNHYLIPGARSYFGHTGSPLDEPAKALKAGDHGVPGGENTLRMEDGTVRYFTVRECARIQTFPDDWTLEGSWTESMRQLGNAVPVQLAFCVARRLRTVLVKHAGRSRRELLLSQPLTT
ncbi:MAG: DNA cytosine methyltransferase [Pirellulaceae bacterium]